MNLDSVILKKTVFIFLFQECNKIYWCNFVLMVYSKKIGSTIFFLILYSRCPSSGAMVFHDRDGNFQNSYCFECLHICPNGIMSYHKKQSTTWIPSCTNWQNQRQYSSYLSLLESTSWQTAWIWYGCIDIILTVLLPD